MIGSLIRAALQLGLSLPTVYKLVREGKPATNHVGHAHRVREDVTRECRTLL